MDSIAENKVACKFTDCMKKLCSMKVKDDMDFSFSITAKDGEDEAEKVCFGKRIKSNTEFSLVKALGILAAVILGIKLICTLCSLCSIGAKK